MSIKSDVIYNYDGSFEGFLSCVFESFNKKELPFSINTIQDSEPTLFEEKYIDTDLELAKRVYKSFYPKIGTNSKNLILDTFLSNCENKELIILEFLLLAYKKGPATANMLAHKNVSPLVKAQRFVLNEAHLFMGFIRFSDYDGVLVAEIDPKNFVLPKLLPHFCDRYPNEDFLIFDKTHSTALISNKGNGKIIPLDQLSLPAPSQEELTYRNLWRKYYDTIEIKERNNEKCRNTHMPKRYWNNMTEFDTVQDDSDQILQLNTK